MKMMPEITSLADFFKRAKEDERYRQAGLNAYRSYEGDWVGGWEKALWWINNWADRNVRADGPTRTCKHMVDYLNRYVRQIRVAEEVAGGVTDTFTTGM